MVKIVVSPIVPEADYESRHRTLPLSRKHVAAIVGEPLIDKHSPNEQIDLKKSTQFVTERFVHGKVRPFLLRSASRVESTHFEMRRCDLKTFEDQKLTADHHSSIFLKLASWLSNYGHSNAYISMMADSIPLRLRLFALAEMLRNLDDQTKGHSNSKMHFDYGINQANHAESRSREEFAGRIAFSRLFGRLRNSPASQSIVLLKSEIATVFENVEKLLRCVRCSESGLKSPKSEMSNVRKSLLALLGCFLVIGFLQASLYDLNDGASINYCRSFDKNLRFLSQNIQNVQNPGLELDRFVLRKESGFGTAPIRYEQPMENGPP